MEDAIKNFNKQFSFNPEIVNKENLDTHNNFIVCGMGGSHLATGLLKMYKPGINLYVHRDYGLPPYDDEFLKDSLLIASSYSGNTEEVVDFLEEGYSKGYKMAVISTGGKLIEFAKENNLPYVELPDTGIQPRSALGYSLIGMSALVGEYPCCDGLKKLENVLNPISLKEEGKSLAENLKGKIPIIYSSTRNLPLAYNWKIKMNETGKVPAFYNVFSELNHNEMAGMDVIDTTKELSKNLHFIFLKDPSDNPKVQNRMDVTEKLYEERGLNVTKLTLVGDSLFEKVFNSLILADWIALSIANGNGAEAEQVPIIEEFKRMIA
ncbi:MAG: glucose/mannose-6-phosphate isomerase [Candidatus Paceibacteria bacterium]|jgi:glucose/mannose-6-phosphate isomerase